MTQIVTFYSFKGGVGRTMALVNTAHALAKGGARVLMVDFDLEAPGMSHFFAKTARRRRKGPTRDALDLLLQAKQSLQALDSGGKPVEAPLSLDDYVVPVWRPPMGSTAIRRYFEGRVDLIPVTLDRGAMDAASPREIAADYLARIEALDLHTIFSADGPGHRFGAHVADYFRYARFEAPGHIIFTLRDPVHGGYDFVLVDSRTGLNEIAGLCIGPLCDSLVICTGLNEQNVAGTRYLLDKAGLLDKEEGKPYLLVVGPVPPWRSDETSKRIAEITKTLGSHGAIAVPYDASAAMEERIFIFQDPTEAIAESFGKLAGEIVDLARDRSLATKKLDASRSALVDKWKAVAAQLPSACRAFTVRRDHLYPELSRFPTTLESLVAPHDVIRASDVDLVALGFAVAMYRRRSAALIRSAVDLLGLCETKIIREHLLIRIAIFFERLATGRERLQLAQHLDETDRERLGSNAYPDGSRRDPGELALHAGRGGRLDPWDLLDYLPGMMVTQEGEPLSLIEILPLLVIANYSNSTIDRNELPRPWLVPYLRTLLNAQEGPRDPKHYEIPGFSLPLAVASLLSTLEGERAVDQVLTGIQLGRLTHGYAWRVLINWKRLDPVKDTPEFRAFLAEEDDAVEEVERNFDLGIWPQ